MPYADALRVRPMGVYDKTTLARYSLLLMLLLPCFVSGETTSLILMAFFSIWIVLSKWHIKKEFFSLATPFILLLLIGVLGARQYPLFDVIKDIWYVGKVIVAIGAGYVLSRYLRDYRMIWRVVVLAGVIAAGWHFIEIASHLKSGASFFSLRDDEGIKGYFITVMGLALMSSLPRGLIGFKSGTHKLIFIVCLGSLIASFSRTYMISYILFVVILKGWVIISVKNILKLFLALGLFGAVIFFLAPSNSSTEKSLSGKFINSGSEVAVRDYDNMRDINLNWRGFESYRALQSYLEGSTFEKFFGQGLGSKIDLGFYMNLGGTEFRYIPILHNGYMYVLVKFGVIGLLVYLQFVFRIILSTSYTRVSESFEINELNSKRLIAAIGWCFLLTTIVIAGPFNKLTLVSALILVGLMAGLAGKRINLRSSL